MSRSENLIDGATAIVSGIGLAVADTAVGGAGTALSGAASLNNLRKRLIGKAPDIQQRVRDELAAALATPAVHMPMDGPTLLPQMFERINVTPNSVMAAHRNPEKLCAAMLNSVVLADTINRSDLHDAFRGILTPILTGLINDTQVADAIRPIYETAVAETLAYIAAQVDVLADQFREVTEELGFTKGLIIGLARQIVPAVEDVTTAHNELARAISTARDMAQQSALPSNTPDAVDTIMAEVRRLNAAGQIDAASDHLTRAIAAQKDKADEAAQAYRRLLAEGVDQAILSRDVDRVAALIVLGVAEDTPDPDARFGALRTVRREWYERGRDKGLAFDLEVNIALAQASLGMARTADDRGAAKNDLGNALQTLGARESNPARLQQAVAAYRAALEVWTREAVPLDWAMTQNNLGAALQTLGERESDPARLEQAVAAYSAALEVRTREAMPLNWATTQNNLAYLERAFFDLTAGPAHLDRAQAHLDLARAVFVDANATAYLESADRIQAWITASRS